MEAPHSPLPPSPQSWPPPTIPPSSLLLRAARSSDRHLLSRPWRTATPTAYSLRRSREGSKLTHHWGAFVHTEELVRLFERTTFELGNPHNDKDKRCCRQPCENPADLCSEVYALIGEKIWDRVGHHESGHDVPECGPRQDLERRLIDNPRFTTQSHLLSHPRPPNLRADHVREGGE